MTGALWCCEDELEWLQGFWGLVEAVKLGGVMADQCGLPAGKLPCGVLLGVLSEREPKPGEFSALLGHFLLQGHHLCPLGPASVPALFGGVVPSVLVVPSSWGSACCDACSVLRWSPLCCSLLLWMCSSRASCCSSDMNLVSVL